MKIMKNPEIYVSVDVEADGPIPGPHSMLSLASVAIDRSGDVVASFEINLEQLDGATQHPETMAWWSQNMEALNYCRNNTVDPKEAMESYAEWVNDLPGTPVFLGYPAVFDFMFVQWYLVRFTGTMPFFVSGIDIQSCYMGITGEPFKRCGKRFWPKKYFKGAPKHTHKAIDDAMEQAIMFKNMMLVKK